MRRLIVSLPRLLELCSELLLLAEEVAAELDVNNDTVSTTMTTIIKLFEFFVSGIATGSSLFLFTYQGFTLSSSFQGNKLRWGFDGLIDHGFVPFLPFKHATQSLPGGIVLMSEKSSWITCHVELESALPSHCLKDRGGIRIRAGTAETHVLGTMLGILSGSETH
jgi:hypothetical protein